MKMRFPILVLLLMKKSEQGVSFYEGPPDQGDVLSCVNRIVKRHFDREHQVTILTNGSKDYLKGMESTVRLIGNVSKLDKISWFSETQQAVVFLDGDFRRDLNILMSLGTFHPRSRFLIVSTIRDTGLSTKNYLVNVVQYLHQNQRWAVAIAVKSNHENSTNLYSYTKTAYGNCGNPEILSFGKCSDEYSLFRLFSSTINYNQCPLRLAAIDWPPYTSFITTNGQVKSIGIEYNLANGIVKRLNASESLFLAVPSDVRKIVGNHDADIGYGQMALYDNHDGYLYTKSYCFVQGLVLLPKLSSSALVELNNLLLFESTIWMGIILVVIFVLILRSFLPVFNAISMLETMALFLAFAVKAKPRRLSQRIYFMSLILFGYITAQAYLANLTMIFMKASDQSDIGSLDELDKSIIPFGGALSSAKFFKEKYPRLYREYKGMNLTEFKQNLVMLRTGRAGGLAMYVEVSDYSHYDKWKYAVTVPEIISFYPVAMLIPNSSTILPTCDWTITAIFEAGITDHWANLLNHQTLRTEAEAEETNDDGRIDLKEFSVIFRSLGMALGLSAAVFTIELLIAFLRTKQQ